MFERYTEKARRTIFFARYEATQFGCWYIETEHLLLGLFGEDKALANQFLASHSKLETIRHSITQRGMTGLKVPTSVDLPLSHESKQVLAYAAEESKRMKHQHIGTVHLLLGLLREEKSFGRPTATRTRPHPGLGTGAGAAIGTSACAGSTCLHGRSRPVAC
jgi:ATP-dependent Clp protease ATP-binding subunit ClpC